MAVPYRRVRAFVMPTFFGPTNILALEVFAAGCPVDISGIYGVPGHVDEAAPLFDSSPFEQLTNVVRPLWANDALCADLVRKGRPRTKHWNQEAFTGAFWADCRSDCAAGGQKANRSGMTVHRAMSWKSVARYRRGMHAQQLGATSCYGNHAQLE